MGKYFTVEELIKSSSADMRRINNTPNAEQRKNLEFLIENVLDPLRGAYEKPIIVSSGYRCVDLNRAVGGAKTSDHLRGMAADIYGKNREENEAIFNIAIKLNLPFRQLIDEKSFQWVHIAYNKDDIKRQVLHL